MKNIAIIKVYFLFLLITILGVSIYGINTIKGMDHLIKDSVDLYKNPNYCIHRLEKELLDIRYRMGAVLAGGLSFSQVHYNLRNSVEIIEELFKGCQEWRKANKFFAAHFQQEKEFDKFDNLCNQFKKHKYFFQKLDGAYAHKNRKLVKQLFLNKWPYIYNDLVLPTLDVQLTLSDMLDDSLKNSLGLKRRFARLWVVTAIIVFVIVIVIYLRVKRVFDKNTEMNQEQMSLSKIAMIGEMASSIVHEINNPLSIIQMDGMLLKKYQEKHPDMLQGKAATIPQSILDGVDRISKIISGLKNFAYQGGEHSEEFETLSLCKVIEDSLFFTNHKMKKYNIDFQFIPPQNTAVIHGNLVQLSQVFVNLINNAADAVRELDEKWIKVEIVEHSDDYEIRFTDSGTGIPTDIREKIFTTFYTTKPKGKGTGLGLSISRKILDTHQGRLRLDADNPNTCFQVFLPKVSSFTT